LLNDYYACDSFIYDLIWDDRLDRKGHNIT
jgi:hypothetical protein